MRGVAEQSKIAIETNIVEDLDVDVLGDNDRLVQVMVNLLSNAIKFFARRKRRQIEVSVVGCHE